MDGAINNDDRDQIVEQLLSEYDEIIMPLPAYASEPHLLISRVRKSYMDYMVQLLKVNYETSQRIQHQKLHFPSAIWRCAKNIEMKAAQKCMIVQIYRKYIGSVVQELKKDTKNKKINKKLYEYLNKHPENDKKVQTTFINQNACTCPCVCMKLKRRRKNDTQSTLESNKRHITPLNDQYKIPVVINMHPEAQNPVITKDIHAMETVPQSDTISKPDSVSPKLNMPKPVDDLDTHDELMMQLEKLFHGNKNDEDLFETTLCNMPTDGNLFEDYTVNNDASNVNTSVIENHAKQIKSLDEKLASLADMLVNNTKDNSAREDQKLQQQKAQTLQHKKQNPSKWLCEEYFLKVKLFEILDLIGDSNRKKLARIKELFADLFGPDSDDESILSPLEETPEFVLSCKERIAPWVVKILTPVYTKGHIKGKALFKALAKHLINLIYQCSHYPEEYEVKSFVCDFLKSHRVIRCEADFHQFRIENL